MANYLRKILLRRILAENPLLPTMPSAAAMRMAAVSMSVKMMQRAAEAAMDRAAERLAVRAGHGGQSGSAIPLADKAHRHGADGGGPHHGQDDAA
jgi:hypothetical protein